MNTRLDRMIKRARAPLSALQPVVPSVLSPEPPLREEDMQERSSGQRASANHRAADTASGPSASSLAHTGRVDPDRLSGEALPRPHAQEPLEPSLPQNPSFLYKKESILSENDSMVGRKTISAQKKPANNSPIDVPEKLVPDAPRPVATMSAETAPELAWKPALVETSPPSKPELRETRPAQFAREVAERFASPQQGLLSHATATEPAESLIEINVSIGSIDFRAARPMEPTRRAESHPRVTLDSYLQRGKRDPR